MGSPATVRIGGHLRRDLEWLTPGRATSDWVSDFTERCPDAYRLELEDSRRLSVTAPPSPSPARTPSQRSRSPGPVKWSAREGLADARLAPDLGPDGAVVYSELD